MLTVYLTNLIRSSGIVVVKTTGGLVGPVSSGLPDTLGDSHWKYSCKQSIDEWPQSGGLITGGKTLVSPIHVVDVHITQGMNFLASVESFLPLIQEVCPPCQLLSNCQRGVVLSLIKKLPFPVGLTNQEFLYTTIL